MLVSGSGIALLCISNVQAELLVEFVKVDCKILGFGGGNILFRINGDAGV